MKEDRVMYILNKPNARSFYKIWTNDKDNWFIEVTKYKTKSEEIILTETMIIGDIPNRLTHLKNNGWVID